MYIPLYFRFLVLILTLVSMYLVCTLWCVSSVYIYSRKTIYMKYRQISHAIIAQLLCVCVSLLPIYCTYFLISYFYRIKFAIGKLYTIIPLRIYNKYMDII